MSKKLKIKVKAQKLAAKRNAKKLKRNSSKKTKSTKVVSRLKVRPKASKQNATFNFVCNLLKEKNWKRYSNITNPLLIDGKIEVLNTEGLVFQSKHLLIALLPYNSGVQLSRLSIWDEYNIFTYASKFIDSLILYLIENGVTEIYALPSEIANEKDEQSTVLTETQLIDLYSSKGFLNNDNSPYWMLPDIDYYNLFQDSDETVLMSDTETNSEFNSFYILGYVEIYFEFIGNERKNFMKIIELIDFEEARKKLNQLVNILPLNGILLQMLKPAIQKMLSTNNEGLIEELSNIAQQVLGVILNMAAKENEYQNKMKVFGDILVIILHLTKNGFRNNIIKYRLIFDELRETMDILSMPRDPLNNIV